MILQTLITAIFFTYCLAWLAPHIGLVDRPGGRKDHLGDIPLSGGIAIFLTVVVISTWRALPVYTPQLLLVASIPFVVGVVDDRIRLHAGWRLVIHYGCGLLMATYGGIAIHDVGSLLTFGNIPLLLLTAPLTALSVAGLCNAYNMIDGIDGLAASLVAMPLLVLLMLAAAFGHPMVPVLVLLLIPLGVFLCLNLGPNKKWAPKVFLGDGGSVALGFLLTASLVYFSPGGIRGDQTGDRTVVSDLAADGYAGHHVAARQTRAEPHGARQIAFASHTDEYGLRAQADADLVAGICKQLCFPGPGTGVSAGEHQPAGLPPGVFCPLCVCYEVAENWRFGATTIGQTCACRAGVQPPLIFEPISASVGFKQLYIT